MSYKITCYANDEGIKKTSIYIPSLNTTYYCEYGTSSLGDYQEKVYSSLDSEWSAKFTAEPASGYSFYRWVYRVGSLSATEQYSYDSTFTYTDGEDIYIRAESKQDAVDTDTWTLKTGALDTIYSHTSESFYLDEKELYVFPVQFGFSGKVLIYTTGLVDTYGFFEWNVKSPSFDSSTGIPSKYNRKQDDWGAENGTNFCIYDGVIEGYTYYIWVRSKDGRDTGDVELHVRPADDIEWTINEDYLYKFSYLYSEPKSIDIAIEPYTIYMLRVVSKERSGTIKVYTTGTTDTFGYITPDTFEKASIIAAGAPIYNYYVSDDEGNGMPNFLMTADVDYNNAIYLWVRGYYNDTTGITTLHIEPPVAEGTVRPDDFSWTYSKEKGGKFNLTAIEWNALAERINEFRAYKGLDNYSFNTAYSGNKYMAYMYNQARLAIQGISGYGTYIPTVSSGETITADMMNTLVSELNAIP